jgi:hypothetical protein
MDKTIKGPNTMKTNTKQNLESINAETSAAPLLPPPATSQFMLCNCEEKATARQDQTDGKDDLCLRKLQQFALPPCQDSLTGVAATGTKP